MRLLFLWLLPALAYNTTCRLFFILFLNSSTGLANAALIAWLIVSKAIINTASNGTANNHQLRLILKV